MEQATVAALVTVAKTLADIQIEGVEDQTGFSNADKHVGAFLASVVENDPLDEENVRTLAALVSKYRRQSEQMAGEEMHARFKALAKGGKITPEDRRRARAIVLAKPSVHPKYGPQVIFQWNGFSVVFADAVRDNRGKAFKDADGAWSWAVPATNAAKAAADLKYLGATILGSYDVPTDAVVERPAENLDLISAKLQDGHVAMNWPFGNHQRWNSVAKSLPTRRFDWEQKAWIIPLADLAIAQHAFEQAGADTAQLRALAPQAPSLAQLDMQEPNYFERVPQTLIDKMFPYQRDGVRWLTRPLQEVRSALGSPETKGLILGDDMGLGKTLQTIAAASAICEPGERILVVPPATLKVNWVREINKWSGEEQTIHILQAQPCADCSHGGSFHAQGACDRRLLLFPDGSAGRVLTKIAGPLQIEEAEELAESMQIDLTAFEVDANGWLGSSEMVTDGDGEPYRLFTKNTFNLPYRWCGCGTPMQGGFDPNARWNIVNYDVLETHYDEIARHGFDILICDEAHFVKNRDSQRSKVVVGGKVAMPKKVREGDPTRKAGRNLEGLTGLAKKRVFMLTGTPLTNRPRDLFNLLKGVKHPLGKEWQTFGQRYCDPVFNGFGTTYNGGTNMRELRERVLPVFLQRKKEDHLNLPPKMRSWLPVEVDLTAYEKIMDEYDRRRAAGELSSMEHHLAIITEARVCTSNAKVPRTIELVESAIDQGEKVLVFTGNTKVINTIMKHFGKAAVKIDGSVSHPQRQIAESEFMTNPNVKVIVGNIIAMGVGLNLTAGTQVIVNDLDWVPANHLQAEDRAYRIGQEKMVNVTYVLAADTFDEELAVLLEQKFAAVQAFEATEGPDLFPALVERLAVSPRNRGVKELEKRKKGIQHAA